MLQITNLVKTFESGQIARWRRRGDAEQDARVRAVDDVSIEVEDGQLFTLLGPSGCGKTTTLRSVAGLESPDSGTIKVDDRVLFSSNGRRSVNVPANRRDLGMVFQSYAIWPHMRVYDNVVFPLRCGARSKRGSKKQHREKVMRVLETMELAHLADRPATKLSGGQQQRLALARAIVTEPRLLLLDEPLSNLDAKLRESLRFELKRLQRELGVTSVYVTHDQIEALALSSRIAVMCDGKVVQMGTPREIYERPNSQFVAQFIGTSNLLAGTVRSKDGDEALVETGAGPVRVVHGEPLADGQEALVSARPETLAISDDPPPEGSANHWTGRIVNRAFLGDSVDYVVACGETEVRVRANPGQRVAGDGDVHLTVDPAKLTLLTLDS
jgi:iron(III) transport system ATP-binding protein